MSLSIRIKCTGEIQRIFWLILKKKTFLPNEMPIKYICHVGIYAQVRGRHIIVAMHSIVLTHKMHIRILSIHKCRTTEVQITIISVDLVFCAGRHNGVEIPLKPAVV